MLPDDAFIRGIEEFFPRGDKFFRFRRIIFHIFAHHVQTHRSDVRLKVLLLPGRKLPVTASDTSGKFKETEKLLFIGPDPESLSGQLLIDAQNLAGVKIPGLFPEQRFRLGREIFAERMDDVLPDAFL